MTWPQRFPSNSVGSQFGWRTFQGKQTFHYGRDQPAGVGAIHRAHADGKVLVHGHDRVYGFYLVVEYTGAPGVRHHIHQLQDRGRALGAGNFKKGDQLGLVGDPLLSVPVSERFNHATYCGSTFSTGPHSHEEVRTATQIDAAIDPAGTQASNIWKTIEATQGDDDVEYKDWSDASKRSLIRDIWTGDLHGGVDYAGRIRVPIEALVRAADNTSVGVPGARFDGDVIKLLRSILAESEKAARDSKYAADYSKVNQGDGVTDGALAKLIRGIQPGQVSSLSDVDLQRIQKAVADELAKRLGS